ncbi:UDP-N-acetylmuramate--L-alanine ligase [Phragmitibacter flavus]|uniref:Multifunctional fusion protein n=1 Tax=Phragmitibacter flavus TaxID=2576071 RepID=A0A5R8KBI1_9BACT|nr:UDP-N-acetylmuramate--L-alanine ligase [Phragmitibacter flavus]TLD69656.1 UDP-N-acetylmuramate--L-alanine ligase [Phragmitibacter flavus]
MNHAVVSLLKEGRHKMRVHLIGVAGSGMSGLAQLLMELGHAVSGSDRVNTKETQRLEKNGMVFHCPQSDREVEGADMVIYSSAVKPGNLAYEAAYHQGIPLVRRAEALAAVMARKHGVVVAGTHGKTTTSSMTAHVLRVGGMRPSHYVGAEIPILGSNAHWDDEGDLFVAEGDESDGTLVKFEPRHAIILNIEAEHLDFYENLDEIKLVFRQLLEKTSGLSVYCGEDEVATELCKGRRNGISYGWKKEHDFSAEVLELRPAQTVFDVFHKGELLGRLMLGIPGRHNVLNALAATGLAYTVGVPFEKIKTALESFRGAKRRFESKYAGSHFQIVDDYGHHPTEIKATLATAKALNPKRIVCLFQPHRYSRTQLLKKEFGEAFDDADMLCVTDVYAASEKPLPGVSGETIIEEVKARSTMVCHSTPKMMQARDLIGNKLQPGDLLITLGAGNVHEVGTCLARDLKVAEQLLDILNAEGGGVVKLHEPMSNHTTIRIGGPAQFWLEPRTVKGFVEVVKFLRGAFIPIRVIGRGSNLLVKDGGIRGAVIHPNKGEFDVVEVRGDKIHAAAGVRLKKIASAARNAGLAGFEWMEGIPGNLGGALRMNAGAMGVQTFDQVVSVTFLDSIGELREKSVREMEHHYRNVPELEQHFAVGAVLQGKPGPVEAIDELLQASQRKRRSTQPIGASAGCIFKNPNEIPAGKLVDELGLKLKGHGGAAVSKEHGNFILNVGGAKARDVLDLMGDIKQSALEQRGILLENEVQIIGEDDPLPL